MVELPVVSDDVKIEHCGLRDNHHDGDEAQEAVVEDLFVAHAIGGLGPAGRPLVRHVDPLAALTSHVGRDEQGLFTRLKSAGKKEEGSHQ